MYLSVQVEDRVATAATSLQRNLAARLRAGYASRSLPPSSPPHRPLALSHPLLHIPFPFSFLPTPLSRSLYLSLSFRPARVCSQFVSRGVFTHPGMQWHRVSVTLGRRCPTLSVVRRQWSS